MPALAEAIALLTGRIHGIPTRLSGDVPTEAVTRALVILAAALMAATMPSDRGATLLRDLGTEAAREDTR